MQEVTTPEVVRQLNDKLSVLEELVAVIQAEVAGFCSTEAGMNVISEIGEVLGRRLSLSAMTRQLLNTQSSLSKKFSDAVDALELAIEIAPGDIESLEERVRMVARLNDSLNQHLKEVAEFNKGAQKYKIKLHQIAKIKSPGMIARLFSKERARALAILKPIEEQYESFGQFLDSVKKTSNVLVELGQDLKSKQAFYDEYLSRQASVRLAKKEKEHYRLEDEFASQALAIFMDETFLPLFAAHSGPSGQSLVAAVLKYRLLRCLFAEAHVQLVEVSRSEFSLSNERNASILMSRVQETLARISDVFSIVSRESFDTVDSFAELNLQFLRGISMDAEYRYTGYASTPVNVSNGVLPEEFTYVTDGRSLSRVVAEPGDESFSSALAVKQAEFQSSGRVNAFTA